MSPLILALGMRSDARSEFYFLIFLFLLKHKSPLYFFFLEEILSLLPSLGSPLPTLSFLDQKFV